MAELPSAYPGGFPNPPKSGKMFFRAVSFGKNVYDAVNRRRKRYDRPVPDPPLPPPAPSPSFGDDGSPGLEFLEPVFAPVLKVTEADLSTPDPAPTPVPVTTTTAAATTATGPRPPPTPTPSPSTTTTTTTTSAPRPPPTPTPTPSPSTTTTTTTSAPRPPPTPTPTPSTTTTTTTSAPRPPPTPTPDTTTATTTMGPRPALSPTPTPATTTTTVPRPAPSPTTATPATTRTTSSLTPTPEPALPITATTTTASPTVSIPATTTTDPDITEISLLCRARNALLHVLPDGNRIATYLAFVLAASGVITLVWFLARSSRTGGQEAPKPEPGLGCSLNDAVASKRISYALNQLNCDDTAFCTYSLDELKMATDDFSPEQILSTQDAGEDAPNNVVYHGTIPGLGSVAIKRFRPNAWPDSNGFLKEAFNVGKLRSRRIANLIGCCCQSDERLIVAEFMPYPNLTQNIHGDDNSMTWALRVQIALHLAQALDYCKRNGRALYHRIDSDKILFDEDGNSRLASFGLMKENSDETGVIPVIGRSLVYSFGLILLELLKKKDLMLSEALDNMRQRDFMSVMDSSLADEARTSDAIQLMQLAYSCLEDNAQEQPNLTKILATLENFQIYESVSDIGKSYASGKINELHDALESDAYSEDELISCKKPSELWSGQPVAITNARKYGDNAFQSKQYSLVVKSYSEIVDSGAVDSPTVLARRSFANVVLGKLKEGLEDARKAGQISPDWPSAYYLEGMALIQLGKLEGHEKIKLGSVLEDKRSRRLEG